MIDDILSGFLASVSARGIELYPAQEEAILEIMSGKNVILNTPTGSGKSLVATAMHFKALAEGKRSYYTCPIKALVSEKFFALCDEFGPQNVGMLTGDASINREAPIICCTAEILSNLALRGEEDAGIEYAIVDEFHYYSDADRGVAWQIPLLTLKKTTFLLMSATMGDSALIETCLKELNGLDVAVVKSQDRPVPLDYEYRETPIHETMYELICAHKFPVYVVHFTQRECVEEAQNAMSVNFCSKEEKKQIEEHLRGFKFDTPFGKEMRRYVGHGVGLHNAGLLPKYRLLVEKLAQTGLLKVIMGTDTLGVGVNIPIRTVLFSKLCKFDGQKTGILSVRDFKQIAGRAGRKGFDDQGSVVCQAPEHVIENKRMENRFASDDKNKKKKIVKKSAPQTHYVHWDEKTFQRLIDQSPEPLSSQFELSHGIMMTMLQGHASNASEGYRRLIALVQRSHETLRAKSKHRRQAAMLFKSLVSAGVLSLSRHQIIINETLQRDFSLHQSLSLYLLHALTLLDQSDPEYALNVLSLVEAISENPKVILMRQVDKLKTLKMAELKADGVEYEERLEALDKIEHIKPLRDFTYDTFNEFTRHHPWVGENNISPKSIAREMIENLSTFNDYILEYALQRSEGVLLRYLSMIYKTLVQSVPESYQLDSVDDIVVTLRNMLGRVDSSLVQEWEQLLSPVVSVEASTPAQVPINPKIIYAKIRSDMHALVKALSRLDYEEALACVRGSEVDFKQAMQPFYEQHKRILFDPPARQPHFTTIKKFSDTVYEVKQVLLDDDEDNDWYLEAFAEIKMPFTVDEPLVFLKQVAN